MHLGSAGDQCCSTGIEEQLCATWFTMLSPLHIILYIVQCFALIHVFYIHHNFVFVGYTSYLSLWKEEGNHNSMTFTDEP